jgi:hypothetical protein
VAYDPASGLFLGGGNRRSIYVNFSPDFMAKVWNSPGSVTAITRDLSRTGNFFVSLGMPSNAGPGRILEIHSDAPLRFAGQDITGNLPVGLVMTMAYNRFEPDVLYVGTKGRGMSGGTRNAAGHWTWQDFNNGMPEGAIVTKLRVDSAFGTIYAATDGRGAFALDTVSIF